MHIFCPRTCNNAFSLPLCQAFACQIPRFCDSNSCSNENRDLHATISPFAFHADGEPSKNHLSQILVVRKPSLHVWNRSTNTDELKRSAYVFEPSNPHPLETEFKWNPHPRIGLTTIMILHLFSKSIICEKIDASRFHETPIFGCMKQKDCF